MDLNVRKFAMKDLGNGSTSGQTDTRVEQGGVRVRVGCQDSRQLLGTASMSLVSPLPLKLLRQDRRFSKQAAVLQDLRLRYVARDR